MGHRKPDKEEKIMITKPRFKTEANFLICERSINFSEFKVNRIAGQ